jgi:hypothetical protein
MKLLNTHERLVRRPLREVFGDLEALGTAADRIWPEPGMPFRRTTGSMAVGVTSERHGVIRALLEAYEPNRRIVWRVEQPFLRGTHRFEVHELEPGLTLARHQIQARLAWWFVPLWHCWVRRVHDRILESLLDRLAAGQR